MNVKLKRALALALGQNPKLAVRAHEFVDDHRIMLPGRLPVRLPRPVATRRHRDVHPGEFQFLYVGRLSEKLQESCLKRKLTDSDERRQSGAPGLGKANIGSGDDDVGIKPGNGEFAKLNVSLKTFPDDRGRAILDVGRDS